MRKQGRDKRGKGTERRDEREKERGGKGEEAPN